MRVRSSLPGLAASIFIAAAACAAAHAQTDISASLFGTFGNTTNYNIGLEHQGPAAAAGGLVELRHISSPLVGFEASYSYNRANQIYTYTGPTPPCPSSGCGSPASSISANAHQLTGDWLFSAQVARVRPFALAGVGLLFTEPTSAPPYTTTTSSNEPVYVYGVGFDWRLVPQLGLRFQYRGNVYKAPAVTSSYGSNTDFTHTAEPMLGAYFRF
jgi:hypothetical protein